MERLKERLIVKPIYEAFRQYKDAFEIAVTEGENEDGFYGWNFLLTRDKDLLNKVISMIKNKENGIGMTLANELIKHKKGLI